MKKRLLSAVLSAALTLTAFTAVPTTALADDINPVKGDANCDGTVDMADAVLVMQALANPDKYGENGTAEVHLTPQGISNADMDGDGLTVGDAQMIQSLLLGVISVPQPQAPATAQDASWGYVAYNGKTISADLYRTLQNITDPNNVISVSLEFSTDYNYEYNGKTLIEYRDDWDYQTSLYEKYAQLRKEGDSLKYGEALYTTGKPDGEKWDKDWYELRVKYYGEEFLARYIVDGEFLRDKMEADYEAFINNKDAGNAYRIFHEALDEYDRYMVQQSIKQLEQKNIRYEYTEADNALVIHITAAEFEEFSLEKVSRYILPRTYSEYGYDAADV